VLRRVPFFFLSPPPFGDQTLRLAREEQARGRRPSFSFFPSQDTGASRVRHQASLHGSFFLFRAQGVSGGREVVVLQPRPLSLLFFFPPPRYRGGESDASLFFSSIRGKADSRRWCCSPLSSSLLARHRRAERRGAAVMVVESLSFLPVFATPAVEHRTENCFFFFFLTFLWVCGCFFFFFFFSSQPIRMPRHSVQRLDEPWLLFFSERSRNKRPARSASFFFRRL